MKKTTKYNLIQLVLDKKGKSQAWLSQAIGKSIPTVNKYCTNTKQPTIEVLFEIAEILDVDAKSLLIDKNAHEDG